jgi:hypothetical protein
LSNRVAILIAGLVLAAAACKPQPGARSAQNVNEVKDLEIVPAQPKYCEKIGFVEGVAGNDKAALDNALEQAVARGATHVRLDSPHPDLEDGMTIVVSATLYYCPPADERFPPDGYP